MISFVEPADTTTLADYEAYLHLEPAAKALRVAAEAPVRALEGRTVWMVNSTAQGGGVAEMLPKVIGMLRELGVDARWAVIAPEEERFFTLTKRLHNLLHGAGDPFLGPDDAVLYEAVSRRLAEAFRPHLRPGDLLVVHDPQPAGLGALLHRETGVPAVWRSHIGLDEENAATRAAWGFLRPWLAPYARAVFSLPEYVPTFLESRAAILHPAIDPLSDKNRDLSPLKLAGVLANAGLLGTEHPVLRPSFGALAQRLQPDGSFAPIAQSDGFGLLFRPVVLQVSRWDRLKGFAPLLEAFVRLKSCGPDGRSPEHRRRIELAGLALAGPDPASIQDDPEGLDVFHALCARWHELPPYLQLDIALLSLPMASRKANALMVNALQRCATVVVQNSLQEGFGLTATEAMWKGRPVMGTHAAGLRAQIEDGTTGRLVHDPANPDAVAAVLEGMLAAPEEREVWGRNGQRRAAEHFFVFTQVRRWLEELHALVA